ncbi:hypothetical protein [Microtetraspora niveoalba]|uniref:hypothetical protein n=1 Tax=Microtetraspora niveoalba TaxID=46175 RepID=UPI000A6E5305|nr:hypothetical protein [Microtetraspora niveoalba]
MRSGLRTLMGLTIAVTLGGGLVAAAPLAASASASGSASRAYAAETWNWGPTASSDYKGWATGKVRTAGSGLRISGELYDAGGARTCSWVKIKWLTDRGKYRTATFKNCSQSTPRAFSVNAGYMLTAQAKVCRGTSTKITGRCSAWEGVWSQGG